MQDMNPGTITNTNIKVFGFQTGLLQVAVEYNVAGRTAVINPNHDLKAGEKISVTLTSGIKTVANENITPFVYTFYVQAIGGTGIFTRTSEIILPGNNSKPVIKCGDIDMDGYIDLVIDNRIYLNNGNAVFTMSLELSEFGRPELADFDNDGDLDILIQNGSTVFYFQNNGFGGFVQTSIFPGGLEAFGDLNGNGFLDISYLFSRTNLITLKNTSGTFSPSTIDTLNTGCINLYTDNVIIDDMNNDGDMDIIAINGRNSGSAHTDYELCRNFYLLDNNGQGIFNSMVISNDIISYPIPFIFSSYGSKTSDLNNDGYLDLVAPGLVINNMNGESFTNGQGLIYFCNSVIADFNGDGYFDVIETIPAASLRYHVNDGSGQLIQSASFGTGYFGGCASGDFDNDGDIDFAFGDFGGTKVGILINGDTPLPVELSSFSSVTDANNVTLSWTSSAENNNAGYDIERTMYNVQSSMFNDMWSTIGFVTGVGTTSNSSSYTHTDKNLQSGKYKYRLKQIDFNGNFEYFNLSNEVHIGIPSTFALEQNYPNPFNPSTNISYSLSEESHVSLKVFDVIGNEVANLVNENQPGGFYTFQFSTAKYQLSSGVYYYRLETAYGHGGNFTQTRKMLLVK
jgi:hypothetical protein